jgi:hypothetical protein
MMKDTKDLWDLILKIIAMVGAIAAFWVGIYQWRRGQAWQRAAKGRELVDDLLKSNDSDEEYYAWDAMKMLDYQDARSAFLTKPISLENTAKPVLKEGFPVNRAVIERALKSDRNDETDRELLYVRECFDELYFKLGQLQDAIDNDLVELAHVSSPAEYYVGLMANDKAVHHAYLEKYEYRRTLRFLDNFPSWKNG